MLKQLSFTLTPCRRDDLRGNIETILHTVTQMLSEAMFDGITNSIEIIGHNGRRTYEG